MAHLLTRSAALPAEPPNPHEAPRAFLEHLFRVAVHRALPAHNIAHHLPAPPRGRTLVLGAGKAAGAMAQAVDALWPASAPLSGLVVTRYGHTPATPPGHPARIEIVEAAHPVPDASGVRATERMLALVKGLTADDLVLFLASGGGSALLSLPADCLSLQDKQRINQQLLLSGASISEMNCVRKHLSRVKGGRLAVACGPARVVTLAISDVPGDDPSVIASGPTVPDPTTCSQTLAILQRYGIDVPATLQQQLQSGELETPKPGAESFCDHRLALIATPRDSLQAAAQAALRAGITPHILSDEIEGESRETGKMHAAIARSVERHGVPFARPCVILSGGETTVTVRPSPDNVARGRGGRAGEFCMGLVQALAGQPNVWALAADTDGIDGVESNAGVFIAPDTLEQGQADGRRIEDYLDRNDAVGYFEPQGSLVMTGPTYTNVNDFRAILIL